MRIVYIVFDEEKGVVALRTINRRLAFRFMLKSEKTYTMYMRKERI